MTKRSIRTSVSPREVKEKKRVKFEQNRGKAESKSTIGQLTASRFKFSAGWRAAADRQVEKPGWGVPVSIRPCVSSLVPRINRRVRRVRRVRPAMFFRWVVCVSRRRRRPRAGVKCIACPAYSHSCPGWFQSAQPRRRSVGLGWGLGVVVSKIGLGSPRLGWLGIQILCISYSTDSPSVAIRPVWKMFRCDFGSGIEKEANERGTTGLQTKKPMSRWHHSKRRTRQRRSHKGGGLRFDDDASKQRRPATGYVVCVC